jgi:hypothetical protein
MVLAKPGTFWESWVGQSRDHPALSGGIALYLYALAGIPETSTHDQLVIALPDSHTAAAIISANVSVGVGDAGTAFLRWHMQPTILEVMVFVPVGFTGAATASLPPPPACSASSSAAPKLWDVPVSVYGAASKTAAAAADATDAHGIGEREISIPTCTTTGLCGRDERVAKIQLTTGANRFKYECTLYVD